jgi:hypothetical protein
VARLEEDPEFRLRVRTAFELQVPYTRFQGRHEGPEWTGKDREIAQAYVLFRDRLCPQCGNPKTLCHDVELDGELYGEPVVCHLTAAARRAERREMDLLKGKAGPDHEVDTAGVYVQVKRREPRPEPDRPGG